MKRFHIAAAALVLAVMSPTLADAAGMKVYAMLAYVAPLSDSDQDIGGVTEAVKASSEMGYNFGLEFRMGGMLGVELDYLYAKHDVEGDLAGVLGEVAFQPISGTLNFHLPLGIADVYGGPTAAYVNWGDLELAGGSGEVEIDPEFAFGLSAGLDIALAPTISATGGLRWLKVGAEPEGGDEVDVDPLFTRIGLALKF